MALEHQVNEEAYNELDKSLQTHYTKHGDAYFLQANGMVAEGQVTELKTKVAEFRDNNIDLKKTVEDLTGKLKVANDGTSEEKINQLVEEQLGVRTKAMKDEHEKAINKLTTGKETAEGKLLKLIVSDAVQREAIAAGVKETAIDDIVSRANGVFRVVDDKAIPYDGDNPIYGADGTTPLGVKDWLAGQAVKAPHLFKESDGGGADNKGKGGGATGKVMSRGDFDKKSASEKMSFIKSGGKVEN